MSTSLPAAGYMSNVSRDVAETKAAWEAQRNFIANLIGGGARSSATIASGSVTPADGASGGWLVVDTEGSAATDDLTNIVTTNLPDGGLLFLSMANASRVVTVKNNAGGSGQIQLSGGVDLVFPSINSWVLLQRRSADLYEVTRSVFIEDLAALTVSDDSADMVRVWDDSASVDKKIPVLQVGRVLQIVHATDAGSSHSNTSYTNLNGATVSITPKSANSKLLIEVSARMRCGNVAAVNATATLSIYETSAGSALSSEHVVEAFSAAGGLGAGVPGIIRVRVNSTGTSARAFGLQGKVNNASSNVNGSSMVWTITEYLE